MKFWSILACCLFSMTAIAEDKKKELPKHKTPEEAVKAFADCIFDKPVELMDHLTLDYKKKIYAQNMRTVGQSLEAKPFLNIMVDSGDEKKLIADLQPLAKKYKLSAKEFDQRFNTQIEKNSKRKLSGDVDADVEEATKLYVQTLDELLRDMKEPDVFHKEFMAIYVKYMPNRKADKFDKLHFEEPKINGARATLNVFFEKNGEKLKEPYPFKLKKIDGGWLVDLGRGDLSF